MYTFGTTQGNKYLQLTLNTAGSAFESISNYSEMDFNKFDFIDTIPNVSGQLYPTPLVSFNIPSYSSSSAPKFNIEDNEVTYSGKPSFLFNNTLSGSVYTILTGSDLINKNHYSFAFLNNISFDGFKSTKLLHLTGGKPIIKNVDDSFISLIELTGSDIHNTNQWIYSGPIGESAGYVFDQYTCDIALSKGNDNPGIVSIYGGELFYYQLTGVDIRGPYTKTEILSSDSGLENPIHTSIDFNSAGKVAFASSKGKSTGNEYYSTLSYVQLTGSNYENRDHLVFVTFENLSGVNKPKLNFSTKDSKPAIVYYDENNNLNYFSLTGDSIHNINHWKNTNLGVSASYCNFNFQPENSFYPCSPVISYISGVNDTVNVIQLTGSDYFALTGSGNWGNHSLLENSDTLITGNVTTYIQAVSAPDPIVLDFLPLKDPRTFPIADKVGISYFDDTSDTLKYAQLTATDFSSDNSFGVYTVDSANVPGKFSSLQFLSGAVPAISYHDNVLGDLKFAQLTGADFDGTPSQSEWAVMTLDSTNDTGEFTSFKAIDNRPAISYVNQTDNSLKYIELTGADFYDSTNWGKVVVGNETLNLSADSATSLALNLSSKPVISFQSYRSLAIAELTGSDFTSMSNWGVYKVPDPDPEENPAPFILGGKNSSIQFLSSGIPAVAHINGGPSLFYSELTGTGDNDWGTIRLDGVNLNGDVADNKISLELTPYNGKPAIGYRGNGNTLRYTQLTGTDTFKLSSWANVKVPQGGVSGNTSLQFSSAGAPGLITGLGLTVGNLVYTQLTGVNFNDFSSIEQLSLSADNWGTGLVDTAINSLSIDSASLAYGEFQFTNEFKLSADRLSAFEGETFNVRLSTNIIPQPVDVNLNFVNIDENNALFSSSNNFITSVIDTISIDVLQVNKEQTLTLNLPDQYIPSEGINPDHTLDVILGKSLTVPVTSLSAEPTDDESCNRIVLKELINPAKDICISLQTNRDAVNLLTEPGSGVEITTDDGINIIGEFDLIQGSGFSVFLVQGEQPLDNVGGEPGPGLGLLATNDTSLSAMSGHIMSIAFDFAGFYGLRNLFKDSGSRGYLNPRPFSVTTRLSTTESQYDFLSSTTFNDEIFKYNSPIKVYRVRFKEHLNRVFFDVKDNFSDRYTNLVSYETNIDLASVPRGVKIGLTYSGEQNLPVKDITYSANVY